MQTRCPPSVQVGRVEVGDLANSRRLMLRTVQRRIKKIRTALGFKTVQATNAYTIQVPGGWGHLSRL